MAENAPQTYATHARFDPPFHFFMVPVAVITVIVAVWALIKGPITFFSIWVVVFTIAAVVAFFKIRLYALKNQDRIIRLEERLRLSSVLPDPLRSRIGELSEAQLIALRFASDSELSGLVEKALAGKLPPADIKKAVVNWRPDYHRI